MDDNLRRFLAALARVLVADGLEPTEAVRRIREAAQPRDGDGAQRAMTTAQP